MSWRSVLGASSSNSANAIRQKYKRMLLRSHPNKGGSAAAFEAVTAAWGQAQVSMARRRRNPSPPPPPPPPPPPSAPEFISLFLRTRPSNMFQSWMSKRALEYVLLVLVSHHPHYASEYARAVVRKLPLAHLRMYGIRPPPPAFDNRTLNLVVQQLFALDAFRATMKNRPHPPYISSRVH